MMVHVVTIMVLYVIIDLSVFLIGLLLTISTPMLLKTKTLVKSNDEFYGEELIWYKRVRIFSDGVLCGSCDWFVNGGCSWTKVNNRFICISFRKTTHFFYVPCH